MRLRLRRPTWDSRSATPIVQPVFATSGIAAFLGVDMPVVPVGEAAFPVLTSSPIARGPYTDSTEAAETTGTFSTELLAPERIQASFFYRRVDRARLAGMESGSAASALASALSEKVDAEVVNGSNGLLTGTPTWFNHNVTPSPRCYARYLIRLGTGGWTGGPRRRNGGPDSHRRMGQRHLRALPPHLVAGDRLPTGSASLTG